MSKLQNPDNVRLIALNSNPELANELADELGIGLADATINHFSDGEIQVRINSSVRGREVYVLQSISDPVNDNLMELMIACDALHRASAGKVNVIMPYYGYARQDRLARAREPITAKLVANLLTMDNIDRLITIDLHAAQVQGFFNIPVDHLRAAPIFAHYMQEHGLTDNAVVVSPDHSGVSLARSFAELINAPIAIVDNRNDEVRERENQTVPEYVIGDVSGKNAIIVDDIIDTGVRMKLSAAALKKQGASRIFGVATHAVLSDHAKEQLESSAIEKVLLTNTIKIPTSKQFPKLIQLSVAPMLSDAVNHIHNNIALDDIWQYNR